jgi:hypothetical protein
MPMADQATARDTGLLHAQADVPATHVPATHVPATYTPTPDDRVVHGLVVHAQAAHSPAGDDLEAVAPAVPDNW